MYVLMYVKVECACMCMDPACASAHMTAHTGTYVCACMLVCV